MRDGNFAWAVSKNQTENFGTYLERIGLVPREQHAEIVEKFKQLGKTKKFGALFEEAGLITHSKLRECLMAHIRNAISSMTGDSQIVVNAKFGEMNVDSNLLFLLSEVLPTVDSDNNGDITPIQEPTKMTITDDSAVTAENNEILISLSLLPGYQYSFVCGDDGKLLAVHKIEELNLNFERALTASISWIDVAKKNSTDLDMEKIESLLLESSKGSLTVQWIDDSSHACIAAAFDKNGKLGVIKHKIRELIPAVQFITA
jgi:predicted regulator of Ras-like GTPase activity (Roadblock/LC7/MglB family)